MAYAGKGSGPPLFDGKNYRMWSVRMGAFLRSKGQLIWDITLDTTYIIPATRVTQEAKDKFEANAKAVDFLFKALDEHEFNRVIEEHLACKIWEKLAIAHGGDSGVKARLFSTYRREYENFTHLPGESIDAMFQRFTVIVNNMRANIAELPYTDHDMAIKLLHCLDRDVWDAKFEAITESDAYETLTVDGLFSKLKSSEVDRIARAKLENPTDPHSLALMSGSSFRSGANTSRQFALSLLVSLPDEEFEVLSEEDLALLTRRFGRMYENRKSTRRVGSTCYRCGKMGHFIAECPEPAESDRKHKHRSKDDHKHKYKSKSKDKYKKKDEDHKHKHKHKNRAMVAGASDVDTSSSNSSSSSSSEDEDQGRRRRDDAKNFNSLACMASRGFCTMAHNSDNKKSTREDSESESEDEISDGEGYLERTFLSPASIRATAVIVSWMKDAGLTPWVDQMGNIHGRFEPANFTKDALLIGSHMDTVIDAGMYDGSMGILCAISALKVLKVTGKLQRLTRPVEVIAFSDEEGVRFQTTFLGSAAVAGTLPESILQVSDKSGTTVQDVLKMNSFEATAAAISQARYNPEMVGSYVEVHLEQGPVLEALRYPLGVVKGIAGQTRLKVIVDGSQGHAGTVPMKLRRDPMVAAAELVVTLEQLCKEPNKLLTYDEECGCFTEESLAGLVCTVGELLTWPSASNVIPGQVNFTVDIRAMDDKVRETIVTSFSRLVLQRCDDRLVDCRVEHRHSAPATPCDPELTSQLKRAARTTVSAMPGRAAASETPVLMSGAGHDAMAMAKLTKIGMLFVRCRGGVSHSPEESVIDDDVWAAGLALVNFIEQAAVWEPPPEEELQQNAVVAEL